MQKLFSSYKNFQLILGCIKFPEHYFSEWLESIRRDSWKMVKKLKKILAFVLLLKVLLLLLVVVVVVVVLFLNKNGFSYG